jgi:hypothetical protein
VGKQECGLAELVGHRTTAGTRHEVNFDPVVLGGRQRTQHIQSKHRLHVFVIPPNVHIPVHVAISCRRAPDWRLALPLTYALARSKVQIAGLNYALAE